MFFIMLDLQSVNESLEIAESSKPVGENTATTSPLNQFDEQLVSSAVLPMRIGQFDLLASVANTPEERRQGLSGTTAMPPTLGKLFVFDSDDDWGIWMKDMNYAIDILWISNENEVVHIEENIAPDTYPTVFRSPREARYVLELAAGVSAQENLQVNDQVEFDLPQ